MGELVTSIRTVERGAHALVSIWVNHALTGTLTMLPEEAEGFRALLERAERVEKAAQEIEERMRSALARLDGYDAAMATDVQRWEAAEREAQNALAAAREENDRLNDRVRRLLMDRETQGQEAAEQALELAAAREREKRLREEMRELHLYREDDRLYFRGTDFHVQTDDHPQLAALAGEGGDA